MNVAELYAPPAVSQPTSPEEACRPFTATEMLRAGYATFRQRAIALSALFALGLALTYGSSFAVGAAIARVDLGGAAPILSFVLSHVFATFFAIGISRVSIQAVRGESFSLSTLFGGADVLWPALISSVVTSIVVLFATLVFVIPGIVVGIALSFAPLLVAERRAGGIASLEQSLRLTRGVRLQLLWLGFLSVLVAIGGMLMLGIGLLAAYPIVYLAFAHAYVRRAG